MKQKIFSRISVLLGCHLVLFTFWTCIWFNQPKLVTPVRDAIASSLFSQPNFRSKWVIPDIIRNPNIYGLRVEKYNFQNCKKTRHVKKSLIIVQLFNPCELLQMTPALVST